jgi:hypothetical protein
VVNVEIHQFILGFGQANDRSEKALTRGKSMTLEKPLDYQVSTADRHIICSPNAISGIANSLERLGVKRALVVCGATSLEHSNVVQRVQKVLRPRCPAE